MRGFLLGAATVAAIALGIALVARDHDRTVGGSGVPATQTRSVPAFNGLELAGASAVTVRIGHPQRVVVHADDNLVDRVTTGVRADRLVVGTRGSMRTTSPMEVVVTVPSLHSALLSGAGVLAIEGVRAHAFSARMTGTGVMRVSGTADHLDAGLPGAGDMRLEGLVARDATARVEGSGRVRLQATRSLRATVTGVGAITYAGDPPHVTKRVTGAGSVVAE